MTTKAIQRTMARPSDKAAALRCSALIFAGSKATRAGQMSAAIELTTYAYSDTNGPEAMAPMAAISQSGSFRLAAHQLRDEAGQPPRDNGEREDINGRAGGAHDGRIWSEGGRKHRQHDRNAAEESKVDQGLFRQAQMRDQFHPAAPLAFDAPS